MSLGKCLFTLLFIVGVTAIAAFADSGSRPDAVAKKGTSSSSAQERDARGVAKAREVTAAFINNPGWEDTEQIREMRNSPNPWALPKKPVNK